MNQRPAFRISLIVIGLVLATLDPVNGHHDHLHGHDDHDHKPIPVQPAVIYKPSAMPDRIVLTWTGDPLTTQSVTWRTSTEVIQGLAEIAVAEAGPYFPEKAKKFVAENELLTTDINQARFHSVTFEGLTPGTKYAYRVGDGTNWSEWFQFQTATANDSPFSFVYFGDAQNNIRSMWSRVIREAYRDAPKAAFLLHAGDLVNKAEADAEWGEWFGAGAWLNAMTPNLAIPGNHEQAKQNDESRRLSHHWRPQFAFPTNGPDGLEETCYTLVYHNLRIVALNSNRMQSEQVAWLDNVLAENTSTWVICTFHHPIYSTGKDWDNAALRTLWKPVFDKYQVDLVLQGHDHTYGRTGFDVPANLATVAEKSVPIRSGNVSTDGSSQPALDATPAVATKELPRTIANVPTGVQARDVKTGTIYVVSVSGPKMYNNTRHKFMKRVAEDTQLYQIIHIDGNRLRFESRTALGDLYDAFELKKRQGQVNELIEIEPEIAPRLRPPSSSDSE